MITRIVLITLFLVFMVHFLTKHSTTKMKAGKKIGVILLLIFAVFSVANPEFTNRIAHSVGIGRGADLLLYFMTVAFIGSTLNQYIRNREFEHRTTLLAREIALLRAEKENK